MLSASQVWGFHRTKMKKGRFSDLITIGSRYTEVWDQNPTTHQDFRYRWWKLTLEKKRCGSVESRSTVWLLQLLQHACQCPSPQKPLSASGSFVPGGKHRANWPRDVTSCIIHSNNVILISVRVHVNVHPLRLFSAKLQRTMMRKHLYIPNEIIPMWCHKRELIPHECLWHPCQWQDIQLGADVFATSSSCVSQSKTSCSTLKFQTPEMLNLTL